MKVKDLIRNSGKHWHTFQHHELPVKLGRWVWPHLRPPPIAIRNGCFSSMFPEVPWITKGVGGWREEKQPLRGTDLGMRRRWFCLTRPPTLPLPEALAGSPGPSFPLYIGGNDTPNWNLCMSPGHWGVCVCVCVFITESALTWLHLFPLLSKALLLYRLNIELPYSLAIPLLGIHAKEWIQVLKQTLAHERSKQHYSS